MVAAPALAGTRTLSDSFSSEDIDAIAIDAGVGSVEVVTSDSETIEIEVVLKPRRGGIFSSMRKAQRQVDEATLASRASRGTLQLEVDADSDDHRFEERWTVQMPARLALDIDLGVGDVEVRDSSGGIELELGVGDTLIRALGGDINLAVGVGDAAIKAPSSGYGEVVCSSGVGDARLSVEGRQIDSDGLVGHSAQWDGEGSWSLIVEVGVGDSSITLE
jgi:hypothetical protein